MPGQPWERIVRTASTRQIEATSSIRLNLEDDPALVPLATLSGRDHYRFPPGEEPSWPGRSSDDRADARSVKAAMRDRRFAWKGSLLDWALASHAKVEREITCREHRACR